MTAKTPDGKEIYKESKVHMPVPPKFGRGSEMGRGPYEKSGLLPGTNSLAPFCTITNTFKIPFPYEDMKKGKKTVKNILFKEMDVDVEIWYLPFGEKKGKLWDGEKFSKAAVLWKKVTKKMTID